jgi:hypothetical protein
VEPSSSASSSQPDRRRNRATRLISAVDCSSTVRSWDRNRSTTSRSVKAWVASGQLVRTPGRDSRSVFTARTPGVPQMCDVAAGLSSPLAKSLIIPTVNLPVQSAAQGEHPFGSVQHVGSPIAGVRHACRGRRAGPRPVRNPDQCLVWRHARSGFDPSQRERPVCGWRLLVVTTKRQR